MKRRTFVRSIFVSSMAKLVWPIEFARAQYIPIAYWSRKVANTALLQLTALKLSVAAVDTPTARNLKATYASLSVGAKAVIGMGNLRSSFGSLSVATHTSLGSAQSSHQSLVVATQSDGVNYPEVSHLSLAVACLP